MADGRHEVGLHLGHLFQTSRHLCLRLVTPDLRQNEAGRSSQGAELVELILVEGADIGVADDDGAHPQVLDLQRRYQGLAQPQLPEEDVGVGVLVDVPDEERAPRPVHLGDDGGRGHIEDDRVGLQGIPVDPDRAHHLETMTFWVVEEDHADLRVQILADGANEMGHDLGERLGPRQRGAHLVETLEVQTLLVDLRLT